MIYEVLLDGKTLYYQNDKQAVICDAKLTQALNDAGTFEFTVPCTNPLYMDIENRVSMVQVLKDGNEIFYGQVRECSEGLDGEKDVKCVGELAFLYDSIQPQAKYQDQTPLQFFSKLLTIHNSQVEKEKRFEVGAVTVKDSNDSIYRFTNREDTLTDLRDKLCDQLSGYLRIRKVDGTRYLDLVTLEDYGKVCAQPIQFGYNLLDFTCGTSGTDIATAVIPLGARLDQSVIEGLDAYTTIESVNSGKDYVFIQSAVDHFGWIRKVVNWEDVTEPVNLKKKAEEWLKSNQYETMTLELTAVDMSMLNADLDTYEVGDMVRTLADPFGMDTRFPLQKKTTYLQSPEKNTVVLSNTLKKTYTQQVASSVKTLEQSLPQEKSMLQAAKDNATALITSAMGGYVYKTTSELFIMDTDNPKTAKKVWRWNLNGLGYSSSGIDGPYGLAMTMDGSIVADFITTGVLSAELIKTGMLKDVLNKSFWNMKTGEMHVTGIFSQTTASGVKSLDIENNQVKFYAWNDDGNYVGSIGAVKDTSTDRVGVNMWCDQGDTLALGCKESDGKIHYVFKTDSNTYKDETPYIRNGANGTMFQGCGDGVTIENGLIKKWNLSTVSGTPSFISGLSWTDGKITSVTRTTLNVSNGLITGWSSEKTDY
ncbi:phage tail protein [Lachnospiraceae bacterium SGI.085]